MDPTYPVLVAQSRQRKKSYAKQVFLTALVLGLLIYLPFIIQDRGHFFLYGDFNVQQIPFYQLVHKAIKSGDLFWNWTTDLGANFIGSYSFYNLFSPFFWLTLPFPNEALPYLMAPLLILKTACASLTAYLYLERFVKDHYYAMIGALLYGFSGWMTFNIFFNHFHEVAVFFPLLLLSVEQLVTENRKLFFGLMVAICTTVNYWFFVGEVVFVLLYVLVRCLSGGWGMTPKKFGRMAVEAVGGLLLASAALLPSVMALMGNPRTGTDRLHQGMNFWIYWHQSKKYGDYPQRIHAIIQSFFFPPELTARPNFFDKHGAQWASLSAWLPMFSLAGVFAYFQQKRGEKTWVKQMLGLCLFFSLVPGLNSLFILLNNSYYARWFFMPILLMALATAVALENSAKDQKSMMIGIKWVAIPATIFAVACGLTPQKIGDEWSFGFALQPAMVWVYYAFVVLGLLFVGMLIARFRFHKKFKRYLSGALAFSIVLFGLTYFFYGRTVYDRSDKVLDVALANRGKFVLPEEPFARSDIYDDMDNMLMYWEQPNIQAFHSVVPVSIMEFYPEVGVDRNEGSRPKKEFYALRSLLSVRWLFIDAEKKEQDPMPGYTLYSTQNGYNIYENQGYIPMGFAYDHWMAEESFTRSDLSKPDKGKLMLRTLVLPGRQYTPHNYAQILLGTPLPKPEDWEQYKTTLTPLPKERLSGFENNDYLADAALRKAQGVDSFTIDRYGFTAQASYSQDKMVFFSVPYEAGWSATVNGQPAAIHQANFGFMAVAVPGGFTEIRFDYRTPGLKIGAIISGVTGLLFLTSWLVTHKKRQTTAAALAHAEAELAAQPVPDNWEDYLKTVSSDQRLLRWEDYLEEQEHRKTIARIEQPEPPPEDVTPPTDSPIHPPGQNPPEKEND